MEVENNFAFVRPCTCVSFLVLFSKHKQWRCSLSSTLEQTA